MVWKAAVPLICFLGFIIGGFISRAFHEEVLKGKKIFLISWKIILAAIGVILLHNDFVLWAFLAGIAMGLFLKTPMLFLGMALVSAWHGFQHTLFLISSLIFVFGMAYSSYLLAKGLCNKVTFAMELLFFAPLPLLFARPGSLGFLPSLTVGALIPSMILKGSLIYRFRQPKNQKRTAKIKKRRKD